MSVGVKKGTAKKSTHATTRTKGKVRRTASGSVRAVDSFYPGVGKVYIESDGGVAYDATLNCADLKGNNNKFYVIQVIWDTDGNWGRVGADGAFKDQAFGTPAEAMKEFEAKFKSKTGQTWDSCKNGMDTPKPGKYTMVQMARNDLLSGSSSSSMKSSMGKAPLKRKVSSVLDHPTQQLCDLILNKDVIEAALTADGYDVKKQPLGALSDKMVTAGYKALQAIGKELEEDNPDDAKLTDLSSRFYTVVPHNFGFQKMSSFIIDDDDKLKKKLELVESLQNVKTTMDVLKKADGAKKAANAKDAAFAKLDVFLDSVDESNNEWKLVQDMAKQTTSKHHSGWCKKPVLRSLWRVRKGTAETKYSKNKNDSNRKLLWHGSRLTNWGGILKEGLRIAPPSAPVNGYMFGKGVYFADMFSKSAQYCGVQKIPFVLAAPDSLGNLECLNFHSIKQAPGFQKHKGVALLQLNEVALGKQYRTSNADSSLNAAALTKKGNFDTAWGTGRTHPAKEVAQLEPGLKIPVGQVKVSAKNSNLLHNEFIIYDTARCRPRYLCLFEFV